jgi:hypothetical protein
MRQLLYCRCIVLCEEGLNLKQEVETRVSMQKRDKIISNNNEIIAVHERYCNLNVFCNNFYSSKILNKTLQRTL